MMKNALIWAALGVLLAGCQVEPVLDTPAAEESGDVAAPADKPQGFVALPGKAATSTTRSDADAAFDAAAAALVSPSAKPVEPPALDPTPQSNEFFPDDAQPTEPEPVKADPPSLATLPVANETPAPAAPAAEVPQPAPAQPQPLASVASDTSAGYSLQITNGSNGRLFIEAQDASGNIFPFGFMYAHQRLSSQPQEPKPIEGQLTIVIRDPDSPGAPEVRRYHVTPPADYMGKVLGITILPGQYRASVDGKVYYTSPLPGESPAAPADSAPAAVAAP